MNTLCPNAILHSTLGNTVVIDSNSLTSNMAVPRLIKWEFNECQSQFTSPFPSSTVPIS